MSTIGTDSDKNLRANSPVTISPKAAGADLDAAIGHEGSHAADAQDVVKSGLTEADQKIYAGQNITPYESEQTVYGVSNSIYSSENSNGHFGCGADTCTLGTGVMLGAVPAIVDKILLNNSVYNQGNRGTDGTFPAPEKPDVHHTETAQRL